MVKGRPYSGKRNTLADRRVTNRAETRESSYNVVLGGHGSEEYSDPPLRAVECFGTRDGGTAAGLVGEAIPQLERCSVVGSSSKWYRNEDPFLLSQN